MCSWLVCGLCVMVAVVIIMMFGVQKLYCVLLCWISVFCTALSVFLFVKFLIVMMFWLLVWYVGIR